MRHLKNSFAFVVMSLGGIFYVQAVFAAVAAAPVINPNGGVYADPVQVSISTQTAGAIIYYTTDGSDPNRSSWVYAGPFVLNSSAVVKALAVKKGIEVSKITSAAFTIHRPSCGNGICEAEETEAICPVDCSIPVNSDVSICPWRGPGTAYLGNCNDPQGCSLDIYQANPSQGWAKIRCANNAPVCSNWQSCESALQPDGLNYLAYLTDGIGGTIRYNKNINYSSVAILHPGGGGANKWLDDRTDYPKLKDWAGLQNDYAMRVVGIKWATTSIEYGSNEAGRWIRTSVLPTSMEALAKRPDAIYQWIDTNLNPDNKPLALLGSSGGAHAVHSPLLVGSPLVNKVKYLGVVSLAPLSDLYNNCGEFTPPGMYVNPIDGNFTNDVRAAGAHLQNDVGNNSPKGLLDDIWNIPQGQPGCLNSFNLQPPLPVQPPAQVAVITEPSSLSDILNKRLSLGDTGFLNTAHFIVNTAASPKGGSDNTMGCTWSEGMMYNHPYFAKAKRIWQECPSLTHGGALSQPGEACFDWIYDELVNTLILGK